MACKLLAIVGALIVIFPSVDSWILPAIPRTRSVQPQVAYRGWPSARRGRTNTAAAFAGDLATPAPVGLGFSGDRTRGHTRASTALGAASITGDKQPWKFLKSLLPFAWGSKPLDIEVAVIGAGVAGLVCARILARAGVVVKVFEASDAVGGRVQTDEVDGFLLDRGFQVFIEAYPEASRQLNYKKLNLQRFDPGAVVRCDGGFHLVSDPLRKPESLPDALVAPVGSLVDKIRVGLHRIAIIFKRDAEIFAAPEENTLAFLKDTLKLSSSMVDRFFAPFYQGIFLSPLEEQSSRMFEFVFKMFAAGSASLPEGGMREVPLQIAADLPEGCVYLNTPVEALQGTPKRRLTSTERLQRRLQQRAAGESDNGDVEEEEQPRVRLTLADGEEVVSLVAVVATEAPAASALLGDEVLEGGARPTGGRSSTCLYFALDGPAPIDGPILVLNGEGTSPARPVNNVVFLEKTAPSYAPEGKSLASVTVVGDPACSDEDLESRVRSHLSEWFDSQKGADEVGKEDTVPVSEWRHLRTYRVPYAQPAQTPPVGDGGFYGRDVEVMDGIFVCGDHRATPTLDGAMRSGVLAAEAVLRSLLLGDASGPPVPVKRKQRRAIV